MFGPARPDNPWLAVKFGSNSGLSILPPPYCRRQSLFSSLISCRCAACTSLWHQNCGNSLLPRRARYWTTEWFRHRFRVRNIDYPACTRCSTLPQNRVSKAVVFCQLTDTWRTPWWKFVEMATTKVALITASSAGLGAQIARVFAPDYRVVSTINLTRALRL
jgi:hypothetical protein